MKLLIEEHDYPVDKVRKLFPNFDELDPVDGLVRVNYVGYYYHAAEGESVFILPKVVLDASKDGLVFGRHKPEDIIDLEADGSPLTTKEREFIYGLAVWIYRAIAVYREDCKTSGRDHTIIRHQSVIRQGRGRKQTANTYLDILLSLIDFAKQNRDWFMFILKNVHSGFNKINWGRTIAKSQMVVQDNAPIYLNPVNKKRMVNFDEELIVIFFSILNYIHDKYGFPIEVNVNYELITGKKFEQYLTKGLGIRRLHQIKYKYFSDKALELWNLCYAFFEQSKQIRIASQMNEFLLAKNFNIVFETMIDELIGDHTFPDRLNKKQEDGKEVDHLFLWDSLTRARREEEQQKFTYYIGDSKYYKQRNSIGRESVAKQFTYARNVIQWNLNLFFGEKAEQDDRRETDFCLRDEVTEGYNVIPNFFISGTVPEDLNYSDHIEETKKTAKTHVSRQYINRLFDRDTLLVTHYDVNFLFVLSLYARDNAAQKKQWRDKVRNIFRDKIRDELSKRYDFHAMRAKPGIDSEVWLKEHFADIIGKVFAPYSEDKGIIALALADPTKATSEKERKLIEEENNKVLKLVDTAFTRVELESLSQDPRPLLPEQTSMSSVSLVQTPSDGLFLFGLVTNQEIKQTRNGIPNLSKEHSSFINHIATDFTMFNMPSGDISKAKYFIPMFDQGIDGYYEITGYSFGKRNQPLLDDDGEPVLDMRRNEIIIKRDCLNIKLGKYTPLGAHMRIPINMKRLNGQLHSYSEVMELYEQNK
ncbi:MAG: restriction endonuclease [Muribaculaceae bacterium]|nr:restriction endonuclease [Muribaculaceae bacterium]